jgi:hypothetical protein
MAQATPIRIRGTGIPWNEISKPTPKHERCAYSSFHFEITSFLIRVFANAKSYNNIPHPWEGDIIFGKVNEFIAI